MPANARRFTCKAINTGQRGLIRWSEDEMRLTGTNFRPLRFRLMPSCGIQAG